MKKQWIILAAMLTAGTAFAANVNIQITTVGDNNYICPVSAPALMPDNPPYAAIGDILCTDGSYGAPVDYSSSGKTAMGIVFYVDKTGRHGWATALQDCCSSSDCIWSPYNHSYSYTSSDDVPDLVNATNANAAIHDMDGEANTYAIKNYYFSNFANCKAAYNAYYWNYLTNRVGNENMGWYLPAAGQLSYLYAQTYPVNASLSIVGGTRIPVNQNFWYWSSTEYSASCAWDVDYPGAVYATTSRLTTIGFARFRLFREGR